MSRIPFYKNPDDTYCFQCTIGMILEESNPDKSWSFEELVDLTGKKKGLWTWSILGLIKMKELGFDVINWCEFDYERFSKEGASYLIERYGEEKGKAQIEHINLEYEMDNARRLSSLLETKQSLPTISDIEELIKEGYLIICNVNAKVLNDKGGYAGHFVLVYEVSDEEVIMHDPGPPGEKSRKVPIEKFMKAWEYPNERERNLMAFKKQPTSDA